MEVTLPFVGGIPGSSGTANKMTVRAAFWEVRTGGDGVSYPFEALILRVTEIH